MAGMQKFSLMRNKGFISGKWIASSSTFLVYDPSTGKEIERVADMGEKEAKLAVQGAHEAFKTWKKTTSRVLIYNIFSCYLLFILSFEIIRHVF